MDQEKLSAVLDWSILENLKNIQNFLSFANFYKRFIRDFSKLTAPLNALAKKKNSLGSRTTKSFRQPENRLYHSFYFVTLRPKQTNSGKNKRFRLCDRRNFFSIR